ncbi:MAG: hypothetical protein IKO53_03285 [Lachnospiraceae bacterium]|nr:hypothetical protein [Lachnospiraceae bacterium]
MSRYHITCAERAADGGIAATGVILNGLRRATGNAYGRVWETEWIIVKGSGT